MFSFKRFLIGLLLTAIFLLLSAGSYFIYRYWQTNLPLLSPIDLVGSLGSPVFPSTSPSKIVYGFFPYWNLKYKDDLNIRDLTHFAYFGIDLQDDGTLKKYENPGELEPGYNKLNSDDYGILSHQLTLLNKKQILVVRAMNPDQIESVLNNPTHFNTAIQTIMDLTHQYNFSGINIDFEYVGVPDDTTRDNLTHFTRTLSQTCKINLPYCQISLDVFADSAAKKRIYDIAALEPYLDQLIVMAYDYYRPSSSQAGPVAPLRGACDSQVRTAKNESTCLEYDVVSSIADITAIFPPQKVLLGIPFYGYEWRTADDQFLSNTFKSTGGLATYRRVQELLADPEASVSALWDDNSLTPYIVYQENGKIYQIHYEDERSLKLKLDLVHQANLGGIAIWALGYESPYPGLWNTITQYLN